MSWAQPGLRCLPSGGQRAEACGVAGAHGRGGWGSPVFPAPRLPSARTRTPHARALRHTHTHAHGNTERRSLGRQRSRQTEAPVQAGAHTRGERDWLETGLPLRSGDAASNCWQGGPRAFSAGSRTARSGRFRTAPGAKWLGAETGISLTVCGTVGKRWPRLPEGQLSSGGVGDLTPHAQPSAPEPPAPHHSALSSASPVP